MFILKIWNISEEVWGFRKCSLEMKVRQLVGSQYVTMPIYVNVNEIKKTKKQFYQTNLQENMRILVKMAIKMWVLNFFWRLTESVYDNTPRRVFEGVFEGYQLTQNADRSNVDSKKINQFAFKLGFMYPFIYVYSFGIVQTSGFFYWFAPYENVFVVFIVCDFFLYVSSIRRL